MTLKRNGDSTLHRAAPIGEIPARITAVREHLGLNQKDFAASLGKSPSYISVIENGKRLPAVDFFILIANIHNVNLEYLIHGKGDMFNTEKIKDERETIDDIESLDDVIWLLENSPIARNAIFAFAAKYFFENQDLLIKNIQRFRNKDKDSL